MRDKARLDVCAVTETWLRDEDEAALKNDLNATEYEWYGRQQKKTQGGEGRGGVGFLVKRELEARVVKEGKEGNLLWIAVGKEEPWYIAAVYIAPRKTDEYFRVMEEVQEDVGKWRGRVVVLGDFNSRVGELPNVMIDGEDDDRVECKRQSKDKKTDWRGKYLMREMNASGLVVVNGVKEEAEWTSVQVKRKKEGTGCSVIDLVCVAWEAWHEWGEMKVWDMAEAGLQADHRMVTGRLKTTRKKEDKKKVSEKKAWRRRDKGDMTFWEELEEVSEMMMGRWCDELVDKIGKWEEEKKQVCEELWQDWLSMHNWVAEQGIGYQKARKKKGDKKMKRNKEIGEMVKVKNEVRQQLAEEKREEEREKLWALHEELKQRIRRRVRKERRKREAEWSAELEKVRVGDSREYWGKLRSMVGIGKGGREVPNEMRKGEGLVKGGEALGVWREAFEKLGRADGGDERYDRGFWEQTMEKVKEWGKGEEVVGELDEPITMEEVKKAIQELRRGKAPGVDGVVNEVLKYGGVAMERALYMMFNVFFEKETVPVDWTRGLVVPLYKDGDKYVGDNYRGITLLSVVGKLYTVVLNKRLSKWCEKKGVLVDDWLSREQIDD